MKRRFTLFPTPFGYLNITQFLGALNDNIFKLLIVFLLVHIQGAEHSNTIVAISGASFVLPFILFSIPSGTLADRFSKRNVTVFTKCMEVATMSAGVLTFWLQSEWGSYTVLFFMGTQSAIFGPSKYGIIPELVRSDQIASANGILAACTVLAIILGTFLASFITQVTDYDFVLAALLCVGIAVLGLITGLLIRKTPAVGTKRPFTWRLVTELIRVLRRARTENYLFASFIGGGFFYFSGAFVQLNILTYALQELNLTEVGGGYLFLTCAGGIALGSYVAGKLSGDKVELGLSALSGLAMTILLFALFETRHTLAGTVVVLVLLGFFGGMFLLPYEAYIQAASPDRHRGENVAGANFLSFVFILAATGLLALLGTVLGLSAAQGFAVLGLIALFMSIGLARRTSDTLVRLVARILYRKERRINLFGTSYLPAEEPVLLIAPTTDWKGALLVLIIHQQRYCRFLIERPESLSWKERILIRATKATLFDIVPEAGSVAARRGRRYLQRGYTVAVLYNASSYASAPHPRTRACMDTVALEHTTILKADVELPKAKEAPICRLSPIPQNA